MPSKIFAFLKVVILTLVAISLVGSLVSSKALSALTIMILIATVISVYAFLLWLLFRNQ